MPRAVKPATWEKYGKLRAMGLTTTAAARDAGISRSAAVAFEKNLPTSSGLAVKRLLAEQELPDVIPLDRLKPEAKDSLDDFGLFRRRYFGRVPTPWQENAAYEIVGILDAQKGTADKTYQVVNVPPGAGKSTLFTCDIPAWLACRDRAIRVMIGSATENTAKFYTGRLRRAFDATQPFRAKSDAVAAGNAVDALATLTGDFGRFKPKQQDLWRINEFIIAQHDGVPAEDKEASFVAYGFDSGYLGGRYDFIIWDDLVTGRNQKTMDSRETQRRIFDDEAESRLEPGGVFTLQGQRIAADDLYRYCLDKEADEEDTTAPVRSGLPRKYRHIIYKSHYEDICRPEHHNRNSLPYNPDDPSKGGCLLDPYRLTWRELKGHMKSGQKFQVIYQQEDVDASNALVQSVWITGGQDTDGFLAPGCWDDDRKRGVVPQGLAGDLLSVVTCDPSPTKNWAVEWWIYQPDTELRLLIDIFRGVMKAPELLDWNNQEQKFTGLLEDIWQSSNDQGRPIKTVIVEQNAAQRFLLQFEHVKRWMALRGVDVIGHDTHRNKSDPKLGVETIGSHYKYGRVRLPGWRFDDSRLWSKRLVDEVTRWPEGNTDDCVMAHWFLEWNLPRLYTPTAAPPRRASMPSWLMSRRTA